MKLKFGVEFVPYLKLDVLVKLAKLIERSDFEQIWVCDHYHNRHVYLVLAQLALGTRRVKLEPGVTNSYLVHPTVTAAAIDAPRISTDDPFFLATVGVERRKLIEVVREVAHIIRELLTRNCVSFTGKLFSCRGARLRSKPEDKVPIYIGEQRRRMLELAGSVVDGPSSMLHILRISKSALDKQGQRASGRGPEEFDLVAYLAVSIGKDARKAREAAREVVAFVTSSAPRTSLERHGIGIKEVESIRRLLTVGDLKKARAAVTEPTIEAFQFTAQVRGSFRASRN